MSKSPNQMDPGQLQRDLDAYSAMPPPPATKTPAELESDLAEFLADPEAAHVAVDVERASARVRSKETEPEKTSKGRPGRISARAFIALIDRAGRARDSLASCQDSEVLRESECARRAAETLLAARLQREDANLERERDNMLRTMLRTARFRLDNLSSTRISRRT